MAKQFSVLAAIEGTFERLLRERLKNIADEISNELIEEVAKDAGELVKAHLERDHENMIDKVLIEILNKDKPQ